MLLTRQGSTLKSKEEAMRITDMTNIACFLFAAAGLSGIAAAVLFYVLDIPKCWRMVSEKPPAHIRKPKTGKIKTEHESETAGKCEATVALGDATENMRLHDRTGNSGTGEDAERTEPLGMTLIQDIVYAQKDES